MILLIQYHYCKFWFQRLKSDDFDVNEKERPGRPTKFEDNELQYLFRTHPIPLM